MKTQFQLPKAVENYLHATNSHDAKAFRASFAAEAVVKDIGRELRGLDAISEWAKNEIFAVNVTLEVMGVTQREDELIVKVKVEGTFDRTGLPDPLVMDHCLTLAGDKILSLACRLSEDKRG